MSKTHVNSNKPQRSYGQLFRFVPYIIAALLWVVLALHEHYFLAKVENLSVFLFDWQYFREAISIPGGFLGVAGSFFTQFLHLPWLGSLIWAVMLLMVYQLTVKAFNIPGQLRALAILPAALLVIGNMHLGYGIFIMREQDHFFAPTLGYMASLIPVFASNRSNNYGIKALILTVWTIAGFLLLGTFALAGTLTAALMVLSDSGASRKNRITTLLCGVALILLVPLVSYNFFTSYRLADSWNLGLPTISEDLCTRAIRTPIWLALLFMPVMALASPWLRERGKKTYIQALIYVISIAAVWGFWFKDDNFHTELAMSEAVDRFDWQKVVDIFLDAQESGVKSDAKAYQARTRKLEGVKDQNTVKEIVEQYQDRFFEPTRTIVLYRDLALLKMNRALDESFTMKDGGRPQKTLTHIPMTFQSGKQFYLQYGLVNMSYRWCLEDVIEHSWSYGTLKYMAMHCIIMQESEFAHKYLNKLEKTLFYRKWAKEQRPLSTDSLLMSAAQPYQSILPYMCFEDRMTNDMVKTETFLMRHFTEPEPPNPTPEYDRAALLWAMRIQNIPLFWQRLYLYINSNKVVELPRSVQEAALLYSKLEKGGFELPYSKEVENSYDSFNRFVQANPIRDMNESTYPYCKKFGKTFYYFYYFIRNLKTY